jgi:membrane associated rhomboid family serine protease
MGMESRRYNVQMRWGSGGSFVTPAIKYLLIANTAAFIGQTLAGMFWGQDGLHWIYYHLGLGVRAVVPGLNIWQPVTYMFLHGGLMHLLINMLVLWMFGRDLERIWGARKFLNYYFVCGAGAGIINVAAGFLPLFWGRHPSDIPTVGASGAIFGVLIANAVLFPDRPVWLIPFPVMLPMKIFVAIMGGIEFFSELSAPGDSISHVCHLGGMLIGYIYLRRGSFFYGMRNTVSDWKRRRLRRRFNVYMRNRGGDPPSRPGRWVN